MKKSRRKNAMRRWEIALLPLTIAAFSANPVWAQSDGAEGQTAERRVAEAFDRIKSLAGEWQGLGPHGLMRASYQIVSGGAAVMETIVPQHEPGMVTLYHRDRDKLMMTHFCSSGNQPRMRAEAPDGETKSLSFALIDVTNLAKPSDGHMHKLVLNFHSKDQITSVWTWRQDGEETASTFALERQKQ
jgi:hypothetical protein